MIFPLLAAVFFQGGLAFSDIHAWRWSEGRGEFIPALSATVDNRSGQDFASALLEVRLRCGDGTPRRYRVQVRDLLLGRQPVEATAWDAIGSVSYCDGEAEVVPLELKPYAPQERPAFAVFGFSATLPDGRVTTDLEGILDYRTANGQPQGVELRPWRRFGARMKLPGIEDTAFYMIRVPAGRLGLAGFALDGSGEAGNPLSRFLRYYDVPPGEAAWLGVFRMELEGPGKTALTMEPAPELASRLAPLVPRPLRVSRASAPAPGSTLVTR
ncbi:MAG: hypothetical protein ACP5UT_01635 [Bryobacteraceae bacterium]